MHFARLANTLLKTKKVHETGELWRRAVDRGHGGATTRRPSPATRPWWWWWWWYGLAICSPGFTLPLSLYLSRLCIFDNAHFLSNDLCVLLLTLLSDFKLFQVYCSVFWRWDSMSPCSVFTARPTLARYMLSSCIRVSVRLSVTSRYCIETTGRIELVFGTGASFDLC